MRLMLVALAAFLPMALLLAGMLAVERARSADLSTDFAFLRAMLATAVVGVAALGLAWVVSEYLVNRPLEAILSAAHRLGRGDLTARAAVPPGSAMDEVARAFDDLARSVAAQQDALREIDRQKSDAILRASASLQDLERKLDRVSALVTRTGAAPPRRPTS